MFILLIRSNFSPHLCIQVASARLVQLGAGVDDCFLVTTTASGMTVCSTRTLSRVFSFAIPAEDAAAVGRKAQLCGAAFVLCPDGEGRHLVVGGHNGACYVFEYDGKGFKFASRLEEHSNAIIDISSEAAVRMSSARVCLLLRIVRGSSLIRDSTRPDNLLLSGSRRCRRRRAGAVQGVARADDKR